MNLHNSWKSHLNAVNACDTANRNFDAFVKALGNEKSSNDKINALTEDPDSIVVVADNRRRIKFVHSCKKFGGTRTKPTITVGGLIGSGPRASPIVIDVDVATTTTEVKIPPTERIWRCNNAKELDELKTDGAAETQQTPNLRRSTRNRANANETTNATKESTTADAGETEETTQTYHESTVKIPVPFLAITALECGSTDPLDIIIAIKSATKDFNDTHKNATDFDYEDMQASAEDFANWLFAVHMNFIQETRLTVEPDNIEITKHSDERHRNCILPPIDALGHHGNTGSNNDVMLQLIEATNRNNEACEETNKIRLKEYEWRKETEETKKDRTKDLHASIQQMLTNASSSDSEQPGVLCDDFISLYNSKTHGGLDIKLRQMFENDGLGEVVFPEGVSTNLWAGIVGRIHKAAPGAFSPFSFSEMLPLSSNEDKDRSLLIEIFAGKQGGLTRNLDDVKASAKMTVSVPQDYHSLVFQIKAYTYASKYIFGEASILSSQLRSFVKKIEKESIQYKNRVAADKEFAAKILWAVDEQVNLFLNDCRRCDDRENVNEKFIDFDELHMSILLHRFNIILPANFHKKTPTEPAPGKENDPKKKNGGKRKGDGKDDEGGRKRDNKLVNNDQVPEFKMKEGETWEKTFQGKCIDKRVKLNDVIMCPRYHTKGYCWKEGCKFSKTHIPASEVPSDTKAQYMQFMACCRASPSIRE